MANSSIGNLQGLLDCNYPASRVASSQGMPTTGEEIVMPGKNPLRGVSAKEEREYEHIKESAQKSGRYGSRAKEVAARTVMKQHKAKGHRTGQ